MARPFTAHDVAFTMQVMYDKRVPNSTRSISPIDGKQIAGRDARRLHGRDSLAASVRAAAVLDRIRALFPRTSWSRSTTPAISTRRGTSTRRRAISSGWGRISHDSLCARADGCNMHAQSRNFWMRDAQGNPLPRLRGETILIVPDANAAYLKFLSGQTRCLRRYSRVPMKRSICAKRRNALNLTVKEAGVDTGELFFSLQPQPASLRASMGIRDPKLDWFTDLNFLRAIAHAVDKQGMINLCFHGLAVPRLRNISPANKLFYDPNLNDYDYDLKEVSRSCWKPPDIIWRVRRARRSARKSARVQPDDQHRGAGARPDVRDVQAGPRDASASR